MRVTVVLLVRSRVSTMGLWLKHTLSTGYFKYPKYGLHSGLYAFCDGTSHNTSVELIDLCDNSSPSNLSLTRIFAFTLARRRECC